MTWKCTNCKHDNADHQVQCGRCHQSKEQAKNFSEAVTYLLHGLNSDDVEMKQFCLEKAFRTICTDEYVDEAKGYYNWPSADIHSQPEWLRPVRRFIRRLRAKRHETSTTV